MYFRIMNSNFVVIQIIFFPKLLETYIEFTKFRFVRIVDFFDDNNSRKYKVTPKVWIDS